MSSRVRGCVAILVYCTMACQCTGRHEFEVIAPAFDASKIRFTDNVAYSPVGAFAARRGEQVPYVDANGDGRFDPQSEASGRCDQGKQQCWIDRAKIRLIAITGDCPAETGTWMLGSFYDPTGNRRETLLCSSRGMCSEEHQHAFQNAESVNAIWIAGPPELSRTEDLSLRAGTDELTVENVILPAPLQLLSVRAEQQTDLHVSVTADESIDMATVWLMRGPALHWSAAGHPQQFSAKGASLDVAIPQEVLRTCDGACEGYIELAHVWRDDSVFSIGEIKQKIL